MRTLKYIFGLAAIGCVLYLGNVADSIHEYAAAIGLAGCTFCLGVLNAMEHKDEVKK